MAREAFLEHSQVWRLLSLCLLKHRAQQRPRGWGEQDVSGLATCEEAIG